jgi:hypothetical protein
MLASLFSITGFSGYPQPPYPNGDLRETSLSLCEPQSFRVVECYASTRKCCVTPCPKELQDIRERGYCWLNVRVESDSFGA